MHAWYVLEKPSKFYQQYFRTFFRPQRIAQIVISSVLGNEVQSFAEFLASFVTHKIAGQFLQEDDLWTTVCLRNTIYIFLTSHKLPGFGHSSSLGRPRGLQSTSQPSSTAAYFTQGSPSWDNTHSYPPSQSTNTKFYWQPRFSCPADGKSDNHSRHPSH